MAIKTVTQQVKEFGAKVKKNGCSGYYKYIGKNFIAEFNEASCESTWWEVDVWSDNVNPIIEKEFNEYNNFERKKEVVFCLLQLDQEIEKNKQS